MPSIILHLSSQEAEALLDLLSVVAHGTLAAVATTLKLHLQYPHLLEELEEKTTTTNNPLASIATIPLSEHKRICWELQLAHKQTIEILKHANT